MDFHWLLLLAAAAAATSALSAIAGFGGGTMLLAVFLQFLPPAHAIPVHGFIQIASNSQRTWLFRQRIHWALVWRFFALLPLGVFLGRWAFTNLERNTIETMIGVFLLVTLGVRHLKPFQGRDIPLNVFLPIGVVIGALNVMVGVVAPLLSVLIMRKDLSKEGQVGTVAICSFAGHVAKVLAFSLGGFSFQDFSLLFAVLIPAVLVGGWLGKRVLDCINGLWFKRLGFSLVVVLSLKLIFG